jgi:TonB family protein
LPDAVDITELPATMTRDEAFDFLNLPADSGSESIRERIQERYSEYQLRVTNAPTTHLRLAYERSLDSLEEAGRTLLGQSAATDEARDLPISEPINTSRTQRPSTPPPSVASVVRTPVMPQPKKELQPIPASGSSIRKIVMTAGLIAVVLLAIFLRGKRSPEAPAVGNRTSSADTSPPRVAVSPSAAPATDAPAVATGKPSGRSSDDQVYFEFQVEQPATALPDNPSPQYPQMLRAAGVEGRVSTQFVVSEAGRVDLVTLKVLASDNELFTQAVRAVLPSLRFSPATISGRRVKQLVQMPFDFKVSH